MLFGSLIIVILIFALQAILSKQLITSALWLAGASALCSVLFFLFGAQLVAVIELSVGAGMVTVLFVFAISVAGDDALDATPVPPRLLSAGLAALFILLLGWFILPAAGTLPISTIANPPLAKVLWQERGLDLIVQVVLIFSGVLGLLGLLAEVKPPLDASMAGEVGARRQRDLHALESQISNSQEAGK
ncbi:MAG: NADH-quinone oxidoreductase subunit J [Anaerolineales bacterium]